MICCWSYRLDCCRKSKTRVYVRACNAWTSARAPIPDSISKKYLHIIHKKYMKSLEYDDDDFRPTMSNANSFFLFMFFHYFFFRWPKKKRQKNERQTIDTRYEYKHMNTYKCTLYPCIGTSIYHY